MPSEPAHLETVIANRTLRLGLLVEMGPLAASPLVTLLWGLVLKQQSVSCGNRSDKVARLELFQYAVIAVTVGLGNMPVCRLFYSASLPVLLGCEKYRFSSGKLPLPKK